MNLSKLRSKFVAGVKTSDDHEIKGRIAQVFKGDEVLWTVTFIVAMKRLRRTAPRTGSSIFSLLGKFSSFQDRKQSR